MIAVFFRKVKEEKMGECFHNRQKELGFPKECRPVRLYDDGGNTLSGHHYSQVKKKILYSVKKNVMEGNYPKLSIEIYNINSVKHTNLILMGNQDFYFHMCNVIQNS